MPYSDRTRFRIDPAIDAESNQFLAGLVEKTLSKFPRVLCLETAVRGQLVIRIVEAIQFHRLGLAPRRLESSGAGPNRRIFVMSIEAALRRVDLPAGNTRDGLLHEVIRALAVDFNIEMPRDLVQLVRKSRKSKLDEARHCTVYKPIKNERGELI
jgi:hypothetical protein